MCGVTRKDRKVGASRSQNTKKAIHKAVCSGGDRDFYTGEPLDWSIISKYRNKDSTEGKKKYKKQFANYHPLTTHSMSKAI